VHRKLGTEEAHRVDIGADLCCVPRALDSNSELGLLYIQQPPSKILESSFIMAFEVIIKNRLETEETTLTGEQLDNLIPLLNTVMPRSDFNKRALVALEVQEMPPFPHDIPVCSIYTELEDLVAFFFWELKEVPWTNDWLRGMDNPRLHYEVMGMFTADELTWFELHSTFEDQGTYLLLVAHFLNGLSEEEAKDDLDISSDEDEEDEDEQYNLQ
jgi:hypothetical protein